MKFRHLVRFTRSRYFKVDYDVYRMSIYGGLWLSLEKLPQIYRKTTEKDN